MGVPEWALSPLCPQPMLSPNAGKPSPGTENCTIHILSSARKPDPSPSPKPACSLGRCLVLPLPKACLQPGGASHSPPHARQEASGGVAAPAHPGPRPHEAELPVRPHRHDGKELAGDTALGRGHRHGGGHLLGLPHPPCPQVWSISYHSWLTFVLLLWSCLIWTMRNRRHFAMLCSPFLVLYAITLCSLQYVWAMDLDPELPTRISFMRLRPLGLVHPRYPCMAVGTKVSVALSQPCPCQRPAVPAHRLSPQLLLTLTFWMLLRRFVMERVLMRRAPALPLLEVSVTDTGEGSRCHPPCATLSTPQLCWGDPGAPTQLPQPLRAPQTPARCGMCCRSWGTLCGISLPSSGSVSAA